MKKQLLAALLAAALAVSAGVTAMAANLTDVSGAWYEKAANFLVDTGRLDAPGDGLFLPDAAITREEVADILFRDAKVRGFQGAQGSNSGLKTMGDYASISEDKMDAMMFCHANQIMNGDEKGRINPKVRIKRVELASMLQTYYQLIGGPKAVAGDSKAAQELKDYDQLPKWAYGSVGYCMKNGLLSGDENGFRPDGRVTRAEVAQIVYNMDNTIASGAQ